MVSRLAGFLSKDGILCLIFQNYDLILIEEATGDCYDSRNSLFPARGMRGQDLTFYSVRQSA